MSELIKFVEAENKATKEKFPKFSAGDTVNVHYKIKEGDKERIQQFQGSVIQVRNVNTSGETFTVRKVSSGIGVERIFPINMPALQKVEINKKGKVRRSRIYYFRGLTGKKARIKEVRS